MEITKTLTMLVGGAIVAYIMRRLLFSYVHHCALVNFGFASIYNQFVRLSRCGMAKNKIVYISDPRALQEILVKEHATVFTHAPGHLEVNNLIFGPGLFGTSGKAESCNARCGFNPPNYLNKVFKSGSIGSKSSVYDLSYQFYGATFNFHFFA
ncbi:unnamed protein product [Rhizoctonia solani]|uniref:Uncharacterized protein n=1 Tax=Rhizoctonia solani TaxID=456999 RepID=A0A8H3E612_9AGAM|nr:unnamed protein product [Rhizoctonia solani]